MHRGKVIHSESQPARKVSTPKNTWTEELRGWGADCPWHPVAQWTADSATMGGPRPGDQRVVWGHCRGFNRPQL